MTRTYSHIDRRTALQSLAGATLASVAGCLDGTVLSGDDDSSPAGQNALERVAVEDTALVVDLSSEANVDHLNLIQPNGERFGQREVAEGSQQVSFDLGTDYPPGEYDIVALRGEETVAERSMGIQPEIQLGETGLFRNNPDKPWDKVYGDSETNRRKNGEAIVTIENAGSGPDAAVELRFSGDIPNPIEDPRGSGIYGTEQVVLPPGETTNLYSSSFPFGTETDEGMGCSPSGNSGQFTVIVETQVGTDRVSKRYDVQYSGTDDMTDCEVTVKEA